MSVKTIILPVLLVLFAINAIGQKNLQPQSSIEILSEMYKESEQKNYEKSIVLLKKISVNDTNYVVAQKQLAQCYLYTEKYQDAASILESLLKYQSAFGSRASVYSSLGIAYTKLDQVDKAIEILNQGISEYPKSQYLYYAKATAYEQKKDFQSALDNYKLAANANIGHHGSHLQLGLYAAREGKYTEALLSFMTCLFLEANGSQSASIISTMESISNGSYNPEPKNLVFSEDGDEFEDLNLLIVNKIALQSKYKTKFTISTAYAKQMHLILSTIEYKKDDVGFWNQTYVSLYKDIYNKGLLDPMILYSLQAVQVEETQKKVASKKSIIEKFIKEGATIWSTNTQKQFIEFEGTQQHVYVIPKTGYTLVGKIDETTNTMKGRWYGYYTQGNLQFATDLNSKGEKNGEYKEYDNFTRNLIEISEYKDNKQNGQQRSYYPSGELKQILNFKDGLLVDTVYNYFRGGQIEDKIPVMNNERNGLTTNYYKNGVLRIALTYLNGEPDGEYKAYHANNQLEAEMTFTKGILNGTKKTYYADGQLEKEVNFSNDLENGPFKEYYPNGQLEDEGTQANGIYVGQKKQYYSNGLVFSNGVYDENGKENGSIDKFDSEGKKYITFNFKKGNLEKIEVFDKSGAVIKTINESGKKIKYENYHQTRNLYCEGEYVDGIPSGVWKYYDNYGVLEKTEKYKNGKLQDSVIGYHPNGNVSFISTYKDGLKDGIYLSYNLFGVLTQEGRYLNNNEVNDWYSYYPDGTLEEEYAFKNGERHGYQNNYAPNGKLTSYDIFSDGIIISSVYLDTNGNERNRFGQMNGDIELSDNTNTFTRFTSHYNSGTIDGITKWYNPGNILVTEGKNVNGEKEGVWKFHDDEGVLYKVVEYQNGEYHGKYTQYYKSGKVKQEANYKFGLANGKIIYYYDNGNKESEFDYIDDLKHGKMITYGYDGSVQQYRYYDRGVLLSYSYLDKTGKEIEPIPIKKEETSFTVYYQNGKKSVVQKRVQGLIHGQYLEYYSDGTIYTDANYYYGDYSGPYTNFYPSGKKQMECNYVNDEVDGVLTNYHPNGNIKDTTEYIFGTKHGEQKIYSESGKLLKTNIFYDGTMVKSF